MAFYSGEEIKCENLDPDFHRDQFKSVFKLNHSKGYLTNMRLVNVGLNIDATAGAGTTRTLYNVMAGVNGAIKHIRLMDGKQELSTQRHANIWSAWKNINMTNDKADSQDIYLSKQNGGFLTDGGQAVDNFGDDDCQILPLASRNDANEGYLDLKKLLPLLNAMDYLDTELFTDLKLEIEYETRKINLSSEISKTFSNSEPVLVVDLVQDDGTQNNLRKAQRNNVVWNEYEHDAFILGTTNAGVQEPQNFKVRGFDNKMLNRLLLVKVGLNDANYQDSTADAPRVRVNKAGALSSLVNFNEKVNFVVNGKNKLVGEGLTTSSQILSHLVDSWGEIECGLGMNLVGLTDDLIDAEGWSYGMLGYVGSYIGENINDLQIRIGRQGLNNGGNPLDFNDPQLIHIFGEVSKVLSIKGNEYNIVYM